VMPELSVLRNPGKLCWTRVIFPTCAQATQILQSSMSPCSPPFYFSSHHLTTCPTKVSCVDKLYSLAYDAHLLLSILPHYFYSPPMISVASSVKTKLQMSSNNPSSFLRLSKFHIHTTKSIIHNSVKLVALTLS